jgi:exopolysaccharide biosynthesis polyprenyl glycosylphosphotransferase
VARITSCSIDTLVSRNKPESQVGFYFKRVIDIIGATIFFLLFAIPLIFIASAIKIDSKGPVIFRQTRVGKNGKPFTFYKFRSMYLDADERINQLLEFNETNGATFKMKNDPRVTRVGRILRRTSIDEIPQLFNILTGKMSLVGPRPGLPREVARYEQWQHRRLEITPGLTGLWQVSGRSSIGFEEMTKLDIYYVDHYSLILDIKILVYTVVTVLNGTGAY